MKRLLLLSTICFFATISFAQEFAPLGAKWHYSQSNINSSIITFQSIECIGDTLINGKSCKVLEQTDRYAGAAISYHYFYRKNDSVYFFKDQAFHLLYDFSANTGDTIVLGYYTIHDGSPLQMIVDSVTTLQINNESRKAQWIRCGDGISIEMGSLVIEGIGNVGSLFPVFDGTPQGPLRCYEDSSVGLFISPYFQAAYGWNMQDCEQIISNIHQAKPSDRIQLFPNPAKNSITIQNAPEGSQYRIFDILGKEQSMGYIPRNKNISIENLPRGVFIMSVNIGEEFHCLKMVVE